VTAKPSFRVVKVDPTRPGIAEAILKMHAACFPDLPFQQLHGDWWIAYDRKTPVAFAGLWPSLTSPGSGYLCRSGVLPEGRGHGLQRRLIRVREREAKAKRWIACLSDVDPTNAPSMNNLFACGYRAFRPTSPWCGDAWVYVRKIIDEGVA
jgi:GNAT superfamily N-acetyltransferase